MAHTTSQLDKCLQIQVVLEQQLNHACDIGTSIQSPTEVLAIELERKPERVKVSSEKELCRVKLVIDCESSTIGNGLASQSTALSTTEIVTESHYHLGAAHSAVRMCSQH